MLSLYSKLESGPRPPGLALIQQRFPEPLRPAVEQQAHEPRRDQHWSNQQRPDERDLQVQLRTLGEHSRSDRRGDQQHADDQRPQVGQSSVADGHEQCW